MPKKRNKINQGLPARWCVSHNAYYYQVPKGLEHFWENKKFFRLGKTLPEAYRVWASRLEIKIKVKTVGELLDRYLMEVVPKKAIKTQKDNIVQAKKLKTVFGSMPLTALIPRHVYTYVDNRSAKVSAKREIALLSHAFTKAVEWGYLDAHPFKGEVRLEGGKARTRYVTDDEIIECLSIQPKRKKDSILVIHAYIRLKLLTGLRRSDLLRLKIEHLKEDGIHVNTSKTSKPIIYEWSDELRRTIELVKSVRPTQVSPFLFTTRRGKSYLNEQKASAEGWSSIWHRFIGRVLEETKVKERFTEHDLRAKAASDAGTLEHARALLAHADSRITAKVYRRKPEMVKPLR